MKFLNSLYTRYGSRKFLATAVFGGVIPVVFHTMGISDNIIMAAMALAGVYAGANALDKKE